MLIKIVGAVIGVLVIAIVAAVIAGALMWRGVIPAPGPLAMLLGGASREPEHSARYYPDDTLAYAWFTLAPAGGEQQASMQDIWRRFNDYRAFARMLDELKTGFTDETGIDFDAEVAPWIGPEIGAGVISVNFPESDALLYDGAELWKDAQAAITIGVRDQDAAIAFLVKWRDYMAAETGADFTAGAYRGYDTWVDAGRYQAYALADNWLVYATDEDTLRDILARIDGGGGPALAEDADFMAARAALPQARFNSGYVAARRVTEQLGETFSDSYGEGLVPGLGGLFGQTPEWVAASGAWVERGIVLEMVSPSTGAASALETPDLGNPAELLPGDTLAFAAAAFDPDVDHWRAALAEYPLADALPYPEMLDEINDGLAEMMPGGPPALAHDATLADALDVALAAAALDPDVDYWRAALSEYPLTDALPYPEMLDEINDSLAEIMPGSPALADDATLANALDMVFAAAAFDQDVDHWPAALAEYPLVGALPYPEMLDEINASLAKIMPGSGPALADDSTLADALDLGLDMVLYFTSIGPDIDYRRTALIDYWRTVLSEYPLVDALPYPEMLDEINAGLAETMPGNPGLAIDATLGDALDLGLQLTKDFSSIDPYLNHWRTVLAEYPLADALPYPEMLDEINASLAEIIPGNPGLAPDDTLTDALNLGLRLRQKFSGIDLENDFFDHLAGEAIVSVADFDFDAVGESPENNPVPVTAMLSYRSGSKDDLQNTMDNIGDLLEEYLFFFGITREMEDVGGDTDATLFHIDETEYAPGYVLHDGYLTLGSSENAIDAIVARQKGVGDGLASDAEYRRAIEHLPAPRQALGYVNLQRIIAQLDAEDLEMEPDEYRALAESLGAVSFSAASAGDYDRGTLALTLFPE